VWSLGNASVDREALVGRRCFGGLDLSGKDDLCALTLTFPSDGDDPSYQVLTFAWTPAGQMAARRPLEQEKFRRWIETGHLASVPGEVIRYRDMAPALAALKAEFSIESIAFDPWHIDYFKADMADAGLSLPLIPFVQGFKSFGPALDYLVELALSGRLQHGGSPILTAAIANAIVVTDAAENRKFEKGKSNRGASVRIDAAVALAMALGLAKQNVTEKPRMTMADWLSAPVRVEWAA
jgi:phage terminase large subunit-like protein